MVYIKQLISINALIVISAGTTSELLSVFMTVLASSLHLCRIFSNLNIKPLRLH